MMGAQQLWLAVAVVMLGYIVGFYFQHRDLDKLETSLNRRIDDLRSEMNARFAALQSEMNARFAALHELLKSEVKRLEDRLERIERPIVRG
jgi:hypothetical protein